MRLLFDLIESDAKYQEWYFVPLIPDIKAHINFSVIDDVM